MGLPPIPVDPTNPGDPALPPFGDPPLPTDPDDPMPDMPGDLPPPLPEDLPSDGGLREDGAFDDIPLSGPLARDLVDPEIMVPDGTGTDYDNLDPL